MKILFTGDSITKGELGWSYVDTILNNHLDIEGINLGKDGDTLEGIMTRTLNHLSKENDYDFIIIASGHNDIILPAFKTMGILQKAIVSSIIKSGSRPIERSEEFKKVYLDFIDKVKHICQASIIVTSLSVINEDSDSSTNIIRYSYNKVIKELAQDNQVTLADVGKAFDDYLLDHKTRSYFLDNLGKPGGRDLKRTRTIEGTDQLSKDRGLMLTIDGVHINSMGAELYAGVILDAINKAKQ